MGLVVARDVSERKRAQETLDRFFRLAPDLFAILAPHQGSWRFVKVNQAWAVALGHSPETLVGSDLLDLVDPADNDRVADALSRLADGGDLSGLDWRARHADGSSRWICSSAALNDGALYTVSRDVTEHRRSEALKNAMAEAERASLAQSDFLSMVGHEIRTPMAAIREHAGRLLSEEHFLHSNPDAGAALGTVARNADQLLELLGDLLDVGRMEAGAESVEPGPFSPIELVTDVVDTMRAWAESRGLSLRGRERGPAPRWALGDRRRLRQVLINLISNAIKFTRSGSVDVECWWDVQSARLYFAVQDTGPGITFEAVERIFAPYHRESDGHPAAGTGLGLAISRRLVRLMGGEIEVTSLPGEGSRFVVWFPSREEAAGPPTASVWPASSSATPAGCRVLVADDHDDMRISLAMRLELGGASVVSVATGLDALAEVKQAQAAGRPFDVVLLDVLMPGLDGLETARGLRAAGCEATLIALTAFDGADDPGQSRDAGFDAHLVKPVDWERLGRLLVPR